MAQALPNVARDPSVGTFHSVGLPAVDFDAFHRHELPRRLADGGNRRIAWDVAEAAPFAFRLPEGSAYSYVPRRDRVDVVPGVVEDAALVLEIEREAWQDYVHELRTRIGLLYSRAVRFVRGDYDDWDVWEPALRCLYSGTPIYDPDHLGLVGLDGKPLALDQKFRLDEDPRVLAHYLRTMGYLVVADVFSKDHLARLSDETDRLRREATEGGLHSWWTRDEDTGEKYPFHLHYMGLQSALVHALEDDPNVRFLANLSGAELKPVSERDTGTHAILKEYPAHGTMTSFANLPWHKDCGLGGCPITCPRVHVAVQLDAANADSSQLFMLAGSAGRVCHQPTRPEDWADLPVVGLETEPGDATVHLGCGLHAGPRPTGPNRRRTIYVRFDNPRVFEVTAPFETYDQVIPGYGTGLLPSVDEMKRQV
ncbi:MAG: phytanoyl-CoA dioxygenase family protein [Deltaproteobacteria bacterium]|nr:phytanoyl-CoA dioxygenase family protein [Deltaproteobacteria bacterium]